MHHHIHQSHDYLRHLHLFHVLRFHRAVSDRCQASPDDRHTVPPCHVDLHGRSGVLYHRVSRVYCPVTKTVHER